MHRNTLIASTVSALVLLAGTAHAAVEPQNNSNRTQIRDMIRNADVDIDLSAAIEAAEDKSGGTAIAVTTRQLTARESQRFDRRTSTNANSATRKAENAAKREAENWDRDLALVAVVTCITDNGRIRDLFVNLENNEVMGMGASTMGREIDNDRRDGTDRTRLSWSESDRNESESLRSGNSVRLASATDLMNASVENFQGDSLGMLDDLAIDPTSGRLVYGVLSRGGILGLGESFYAMPSDELANFRNGTVRIDLNEEDFKGIKGFNAGKWPMRADNQWDTNWVSESDTMPKAQKIVRGSELIGMDVNDRAGETVGEIEDVIVDAKHGKAVYVVVSTDRGSMPVPFSVLGVNDSDESVSISKSRSDLRNMETVDDSDEFNWNNARWNRRIHEAYGQKPTWMKKQNRSNDG